MNPTVTITAVAHGGDGIARIDGQVCFVAYGLPGDVARVRIVNKSRGVLWGEIVELIEPSPDRILVTCPAYGRCGGCSWLHFAYPAQAEWKVRTVRDCFNRIAKIDTGVEWRENADLRLGYRTRAEFRGDGERFGFFAAGSHDIVDIESCPLCHERLNDALLRLRAERVRGAVEVTVNPEGDETLVWSREPIPEIQSAFPNAQWLRDERPRQYFLFDGAPIVNGAFSQSSLLLNRVLVEVVKQAVGQPATLLDLYCGNGNFSLAFTECAEVTGLDHNRSVIGAVRESGKGDYRTADELTFKKALRDKRWDVVLLDPPRTGAKTIAPALAECGASRIVYVSCDPATLARDVKTIVSSGRWRSVGVTAVDMFPHTPHVESVCVLEPVG